MTETMALVPYAYAPLSEEDKLTYAGYYLMKMMDLDAKDGGMVFPLALPSELTPLEEVLFHLHGQELVTMNRRKERWELTKAGIARLGSLIEEAEDLLDEFDDLEVEETVDELRRRNLDPFRARFLWGWFDGELDDLVLFQQRRGVVPVQTLWAYYLTGDELWANLALDLTGDGPDDPGDRD